MMVLVVRNENGCLGNDYGGDDDYANDSSNEHSVGCDGDLTMLMVVVMTGEDDSMVVVM